MARWPLRRVPSIKRPVFMDGKHFRRVPSIKKAVFMDGILVLVLESILIERSYFLSGKGFVVETDFVHLAFVNTIASSHPGTKDV